MYKAEENSALAASSIPANQIGELDKSKVAGVEALSMPGNQEGEVKMVKNGGIVEAYQWSNAQVQWIKIGEVVHAVGNNRKQVFAGKEYDYVFDVDLQEGAPPLKLPYNKGENPLSGCSRFYQCKRNPTGLFGTNRQLYYQKCGRCNFGSSDRSVR